MLRQIVKSCSSRTLKHLTRGICLGMPFEDLPYHHDQKSNKSISGHHPYKLNPSVYRYDPVHVLNPDDCRLKAVILDWSGTLADADVIAPAIAFQNIFRKYGIEITMEEARKPMGIRKDLHIEAILKMPRVTQKWKKVHDREPLPEDVGHIYRDFIPVQLEILAKYSKLIPGAVEAIDQLRRMGIKIGSTTGFSRSMVNILVKEAEKQGYSSDVDITGDDIYNDLGNRPLPFMIWENLFQLGVWPIQSVAKVDDTVSGIQEGLNAGCWTIGVSRYSNYTMINSLEERAQLSPDQADQKNEEAREILASAGAHYVADSVVNLPEIAEDINRRLSRGERP